MALPRELCHRVLGRVEHELVLGGGHQVDLQFVGDLQQVQQHVGQFLADGGAPVHGKIAALLFRQPLEMLQQFGRFDRQGRGQVLGRMELIPVPLRRELPQRGGE